MTVYRKCRPCKHRDGCEIKARLAEAIKGFGVGTISHACKSFEPDLKPGDNVWVAAMAHPYSIDDYGSPPVAQFPAHFVQYSKTLGRAIVYIEPGTRSRDGEHEFGPANGKNGFCKVSYAPYRTKFTCGLDKGIVERREGRTPMQECCGLPIGKSCEDCKRIPNSSLAALRQ
jgi:hypothetical protein